MHPPAVIPFRPVHPKRRLSGVLDPVEREEFARAMLADVADATAGAGCHPVVLSTRAFPFAAAPVEVMDAGLNEALTAWCASREGPVLVIMADLPLATPETVRRLLSSGADVTLVPGRGGGTNAILLRDCRRFRFDYYEASFLKHQAIAADLGLSCAVFDSFRLYTDVDERDDLVEVLLHGTGRARVLLVEKGFSLSQATGRVTVVRGSGSPAT